ncbi:Serine/threonine-protein phosphatase 7 long form [Glycine soja]
MQVAGGIGTFRDDVTPDTGVISAVSALQEVGLASQTGELRGAGQQRPFPRVAVCNAQRLQDVARFNGDLVGQKRQHQQRFALLEDQWHLHRHVYQVYKRGLVQLRVTFCGCNPSMFQNMFEMGKQTENYTSDEQCRRIKVKNKYQRKLFLYFGNVVLLCLRTDGAPLIGSTNLDWADLCEELLGVRPQEGELEGSVVKLSWLAHHFSHINIDEGNVEQLQRFTHAWILRFIRGVLFVNKSSSRVSLRYLQFLRDFEQCSTYAWGPAVLAYLYREMCSAADYKVKSIRGMCILIQMWAWERCTTLAPKRAPPVIENKPLGHRWLRRGNQHIGNDDLRVFRRKLDLIKQHEFVWEPYTTTVMAALPPICVVGSVAWFAVVPLICFHVVEVLRQFGLQQPIPGFPSQPQNLHGITLKGKQDENWFHLLAPFISQWNNAAEFRVDVYPRQEGLLGFNSDYMGEVVETLQYMVSPQGRNTWAVDDLVPYVDKLAIISEEQERITEPVSHGPTSEREFPAQEFHILQLSVETRGIGRRREPRGHGMYYTPATFSEYPSQMYQYPFAGHHTDTFETSHSFGGVAKTQPHFSWPTMTPSQQHDAPMATPNAPFAPQWNVPGAIPDMGDLLGVDLRQERGIDNAVAEEILIVKREDGIDHGEGMMQSYPPRALDRRLQEDWAKDAREGPRVLMSLRTHLLLEVASPLSSFSIPLPFIFQEAKESIDEEDPRPTSSNGACINGSTQSISFLILVDFGRPFARIVVGSGISVHVSLEGGIAASFPRDHHCADDFTLHGQSASAGGDTTGVVSGRSGTATCRMLRGCASHAGVLHEISMQGVDNIDEGYYGSLIGCPMYLTTTRSNILFSQKNKTEIFVDNQVAIAVANNLVCHGKTKHFNIKVYYLIKIQQSGEVNLIYCKSKDQLADMFTKSLPINKLELKELEFAVPKARRSVEDILL